jgi:hypothetical protein
MTCLSYHLLRSLVASNSTNGPDMFRSWWNINAQRILYANTKETTCEEANGRIILKRGKIKNMCGYELGGKGDVGWSGRCLVNIIFKLKMRNFFATSETNGQLSETLTDHASDYCQALGDTYWPRQRLLASPRRHLLTTSANTGQLSETLTTSATSGQLSETLTTSANTGQLSETLLYKSS